MHPKQAEAERRKEERAKTLARGKEIMEVLPGLHFLDRPPTPGNELVHAMSGMTLVYEVTGKRRISFSTALVHPVDRYSKKMGRAVAAINFAEGRWTSVRLPAHYKANDQRHIRAYMERILFSM